ncbi:MAG: restriction endonuclease subunit S [Candidatus Dormibacteria bacterium]
MTQASWPVVPLESLCSFHNGGTPSRAVPQFFDGDIPWLTGADIRGPLAGECRTYLTEAGIRSSPACKVPKGTVLLVTRTSVGKVAVAGRELSFSQDITALCPDEDRVDTSYLVHFLRTQEKRFQLGSRGATIKGITREVVATTRVPLPPVAEQGRIADILDQADALRCKRRTMVADLDTLTYSIFVHMFGNSLTSLMEFPLVPLGEVAEIQGGLQVTSKRRTNLIEVPYLRVANVHRGSLDLSDPDIATR